MLLISRFMTDRGWAFLSAGLMFVLALASLQLVTGGGRVATLWLANATIIALLLRRPPDSWPELLGAALLGNLSSNLLTGTAPALAISLALCNIVEIMVVALLFRRRFVEPDELFTVGGLGALALMAMLGATASTALAFASLLLFGGPEDSSAAPWFLADLNGLLILVPLLLSLTGSRQADDRQRPWELPLLLLLAAAVTLTIFSYRASSLFMTAPVLVLAALRLDVRRSAMVVATVCAIAAGMTASGHGPLNAPHVLEQTRVLLLQLFMSTAVLLTLPVAALNAERSRTAAELQRKKDQYRLLANHGSDLILQLDPDGRAGFVSSAAHRLLGLAPAALAGTALVERLHAQDRPRFFKALRDSLRSGEAGCCFRIQHASGDWRWVEATIRLAGRDGAVAALPAPLPCEAASEGRCSAGAAAPCPKVHNDLVLPDTDPGGVALVASLRDIHQRRRAEQLVAERSRKLGETNRMLLMAEGLASLGHWVLDPQRDAILLSPEAQTLVKLPSATLSVREALGFVAAGDRRTLLARVVRARRADEPVECVVRFGPPEAERTLQLRMQRGGADDGGHGLFGVISDITEKLAAEQRLVTALADARTAAEARSRFLATMSHEIRTPMTGVLGTIELLNDDPGPEQRKLYLDTMRQSADLLMSVLNDILDYSKVDSGNFTFTDEPFDLSQTLLAAVRLFDRPASAKGLRLKLEGPAGDAWVRGDALRIQQVLSNLLSNAIKFSERGIITVRCSVQPKAGTRAAIRLTVEDKGPGISPAAQAQLFEPFIQGEAAVGRGGTGLGLAISRRLVTGMGGTIAVRSALGRGSAFTVSLTLPLAAPAPRAGKRLTRSSKRALDILLAEDNPVNQLLVTALLKRMGHQVTCAADGLVAIEMAAKRRFDLILMDMQMPRCDGLGAARRIRGGQGPNHAIPIVALTADTGVGRRSVYADSGIDAVLTKPVDCAALSATLDRLCDTGDVPGQVAAPPTPPLDDIILDEVRDLLGPARLADLLGLLSDELDTRPGAIRSALADRDAARAAAEAHSLKGAAANLGAKLVAEAAFGLEQVIHAADPSNHTDLGPALRRLAEAVEQTRDALSALPRETAALAAHG